MAYYSTKGFHTPKQQILDSNLGHGDSGKSKSSCMIIFLRENITLVITRKNITPNMF